ncbi:MAG: serine/threonine protein kinase [Pseudonocardiaceae bacterium]
MAGWSVPGVVHLKEMGADPAGRRVLARHRLTRRSLAITYLSPEFLADAEFRARFGVECARLARVREARIARVHRYVECDHGVDEHHAAVIGDHISGIPLRALLLDQGAVGTAAALVVLKDALLALAACHKAGLAHGNLKPEDVILTPAGRVRLVDFGLWTSDSRRLLARSTPFYLAPEQWSGPGVSQGGDIYAATVTFFECLAGAPPFYADEVAELSAKHARSVPPVEVVPEPVRDMVLRGLAKDPGSRPEARRLLALVGDVAARAVGPDWERQGRQELAALIANCSAPPELSTVNCQRAGDGWGYGKPVRLAAVMGGALALAAGLSSPPLAVIPRISIFGSGVMPPVQAFPDAERNGVAVRVMTNGPLADRAPAVAAKVGIAAPRPPAPSVPAPGIHTAPYDHAAPEGVGQGTARPDRAAPNQSGLDQPVPALPVCTGVDDHKPCTAANPAQPGSTGSPSDPSPPSVPVSLPVPVPVRLPVPVKVPVQPSAPVLQPVKVPKSITIRDKTEYTKDIHIPKDFQAQPDSQRSRKTVRADWPNFTGNSVDHPTSRSQRGYGHFTGTGNSGNR